MIKFLKKIVLLFPFFNKYNAISSSFYPISYLNKISDGRH